MHCLFDSFLKLADALAAAASSSCKGLQVLDRLDLVFPYKALDHPDCKILAFADDYS